MAGTSVRTLTCLICDMICSALSAPEAQPEDRPSLLPLLGFSGCLCSWVTSQTHACAAIRSEARDANEPREQECPGDGSDSTSSWSQEAERPGEDRRHSATIERGDFRACLSPYEDATRERAERES